MTGAGRCDPLVLFRVTRFDRKRLLPILPVTVFQLNRYRGADGFPVAHAREDMGGIPLNLHATAATVSLLAAPEFAVDECLVDLESGRHAGEEGYQGFAVGFPCCEVAQHLNF